MNDAEDELCGHLRSARESLCRAQTGMTDHEDIDLLSAAMNRIDLVGMQLAGWSKHDRPNAWWDLHGDTGGALG